MKSTRLLMMAIAVCGALTGCTSGKTTPAAATQTAYMPKAQIYRMSGDYSAQIPVNVDSTTGQLLSYPSPGDITAASKPVRLADGWWLDRRGITPATVFTSYTYTQYMQMAQPPRPGQLLEAILPGAVVTQIVALPFTTTVAEKDIPAVNRLIHEELPGCTTVYAQ